VLQLRHAFLRRRFLRELPGQHELGFKHITAFDPTVERCRHPMQSRMPAPHLDVRDYPPRLGLVPVAVKFLGDAAELHNQIAGQVLGIDFATLFPPQALQRGFIVAHDDPGVRAANEVTPAHFLYF
jgi:hypothetical protein